VRHSKVLVAPLVVAVLMVACSDDDETPATSTVADGAALSVHIPAEYEEAVGLVVDAFESENPDADVEVVVEEMDGLTASVVDETADVAILPQLWLDDLDSTAPTGEFGRNLPIIVVPEGNPGGIEGTEAFASDSGLSTAVCGPETAIGKISVLALGSTGVTPDPATVAAGCEAEVVSQVAAGELDAAFIYRMGTVLPDGVEVVDAPVDDNFVFEITYVVVDESAAADDLIEFIASDTGQEILTENGYLP
jgi:ABC-type molybdate transport system substrate-binding protein